MTKLRLLHVSDLHYQAEKNADSALVLSALREDIQLFVTERSFKADAVVFSGDLAFSGCTESEFDGALGNALLPLASACSLDVDRLFVAPGNHDICRDTVRSYSALNEGLAAQLTSSESINAFLERLSVGSAQEALSVARLESFRKFEAKRLPHQQACITPRHVAILGNEHFVRLIPRDYDLEFQLMGVVAIMRERHEQCADGDAFHFVFADGKKRQNPEIRIWSLHAKLIRNLIQRRNKHQAPSPERLRLGSLRLFGQIPG